MLGVNMPVGRGGSSSVGGAITPSPVAGGPAQELGLATANLTVSPTLTPRSLDLLNPPYDATATKYDRPLARRPERRRHQPGRAGPAARSA